MRAVQSDLSGSFLCAFGKNRPLFITPIHQADSVVMGDISKSVSESDKTASEYESCSK
jgi:hypothetical protein